MKLLENTLGLGEIDISSIFVKGIKIILSLLIITILIALFGGVVKTIIDLSLLFSATLDVALRKIILDILILLAVVEIFRTTLAYFTEGRIKVTFIIDTILVVILTETLSLWFNEMALGRLWAILILIGSLGIMRIIAIKYSPTVRDNLNGGSRA
ncbi:MAG: phosphate-starvation-inducible PsiE family protein [Nitrospirota bacterium]